MIPDADAQRREADNSALRGGHRADACPRRVSVETYGDAGHPHWWHGDCQSPGADPAKSAGAPTDRPTPREARLLSQAFETFAAALNRRSDTMTGRRMPQAAHALSQAADAALETADVYRRMT
jgi:hypothetical protein